MPRHFQISAISLAILVISSMTFRLHLHRRHDGFDFQLAEMPSRFALSAPPARVVSRASPFRGAIAPQPQTLTEILGSDYAR